MTAKKTIIGTGIALVLVVGALSAQAGKVPPASNKKGVTFAKDIKGIFETHKCFNCHGAEKQKGKLRLDTLDWVKKGARGEAVGIVGKSGESPLVLSTSRVDEDEAMPPEGKGDPLTASEIGLIRAWIDQGMK